MASTPKETTTKTEPWDGAKPYITKYLAQADKAYTEGKPLPFQGSTVAAQSAQTLAAQAAAEKLATGGGQNLTNAANTVAGITGGNNISPQANNTLSNLQNGVKLGSNPAQNGVNSIAQGSQTGLAPGTSTIKNTMNYSDPTIAKTGQIANSLNANYTNPGVAATQNAAKGITGSYTNPGVAATQQAMQSVNTNYVNPAAQQAASANSFTNAGMSAQQAQTKALAGGKNPAQSILEQTANGSMLNSNPYLDEAINKANSGLVSQYKNEIAPGIDSQFAAAGRMGSGAFAAARNNADSALTGAMSKNANDIMMQNYTQERNNQLNAQNSIGNFYNSDQQNQMNANANLANTSNSQQQQRLAGTQLYGSLNDSQQSQRYNQQNLAMQGANQLGQQSLSQQGMNNDLDNMRLGAANQLGNQSQQQQAMRNDQYGLMLNAQGQLSDQNLQQNQQQLQGANAANAQYQFDKNYQMQGLGMQNDMYNQGIANQFQNNSQMLNAANSQFGNQNAQANTQLQGANTAGQMYQNQFMPSQQLAQIGAQKDAYADLLKQAEVAKWDQQQNQPFVAANNMINMANGGGYNNQTSQVFSNSGAQFAGLAGTLMTLLCDERAKNIIRQVGFLPNGIPMYEFTYKNDAEQTVWIGPMAQEVEQVIPEAVIEVDGIKRVIADKLFEEAA